MLLPMLSIVAPSFIFSTLYILNIERRRKENTANRAHLIYSHTQNNMNE